MACTCSSSTCRQGRAGQGTALATPPLLGASRARTCAPQYAAGLDPRLQLLVPGVGADEVYDGNHQLVVLLVNACAATSRAHRHTHVPSLFLRRVWRPPAALSRADATGSLKCWRCWHGIAFKAGVRGHNRRAGRARAAVASVRGCAGVSPTHEQAVVHDS